ncbi:MAG: nitroreductase family protein [Candidatus Nezhaarchaeota archaeon]|nr:nitroreductase family protein [Candidatus Nezhaarchaeota archaeon]MCX8142460.1 nitroreductase family protein [Candidatus Nezhaarchaeota archaeon]MDW8050567.1 nitroreductase family protein [Nitrososphaerota archaeon]
MEVLEAIKTRRSVRKFKRDRVPLNIVKEILEAGRWAPSARNSQPWRFILIVDEDLKRRVAEATTAGKFLANAPLGIAVTVDPSITRHPVEDGASATMNMLLAAHALGLGACWIGSHGSVYEDRVKELLNIPRDWILLSIIALGYPDEKPSSSRVELKELIYINKFGSRIELEEVLV